MYTIYIQGQIEFGLDKPLPAPRDSIEELGYVPGGPRIRRLGLRGIQRAAFVIKRLYKRGTKGLCKILLKSHRLDVVDFDQVHEFERVLTEAGLPEDVESIPRDDVGDADDDDECAVPRHEDQTTYNFGPSQTSQPSQFGPPRTYSDFSAGPS